MLKDVQSLRDSRAMIRGERQEPKIGSLQVTNLFGSGVGWYEGVASAHQLGAGFALNLTQLSTKTLRNSHSGQTHRSMSKWMSRRSG